MESELKDLDLDALARPVAGYVRLFGARRAVRQLSGAAYHRLKAVREQPGKTPDVVAMYAIAADCVEGVSVDELLECAAEVPTAILALAAQNLPAVEEFMRQIEARAKNGDAPEPSTAPAEPRPETPEASPAPLGVSG